LFRLFAIEEGLEETIQLDGSDDELPAKLLHNLYSFDRYDQVNRNQVRIINNPSITKGLMKRQIKQRTSTVKASNKKFAHKTPPFQVSHSFDMSTSANMKAIVLR
jgi:hypothetical protein